MEQQPSQPISVFFSYSREDMELRNKLGKHLRSLERQGVISSWYDRLIQAGSEWKEEIEHHIHTADIILLLISSDFIDSKYCYEIEMPQAIARHDAGEACVVPILLRPVEGWQYLPFAKLQVYPSGGKPVTDWANLDSAYVDIVGGIRGAVNQLLEQRQQQVQAFESWLKTIDLPLSDIARSQLPQWQKQTGLTDGSMVEKITTAQTDRQQQAERARIAEIQRQERLKAEAAAREAEAQRQAEQQRREQAERDRQAEQQRREQLERDRLERERLKASQAQPKSFTIHVTKRKLFGGGDRIPLIEMVEIPGGKFWMGSPNGEGRDTEKPRHEVTITPFYMSKYPITQAQYQAVMDKNPSLFKGEKRPVESVSWRDAIAFCKALSKLSVHGMSPGENREVTLPSEAQWEYACRAGTETPFYFGETISAEQVNHVNLNGTSDVGIFPLNLNGTSDVGIFPPNQFGLYDMHGNVWEWCLDHWHKSYDGAPINGSAWLSNDKNASRLLRGGSRNTDPGGCRSAYRSHRSPVRQILDVGFRVVCV
jgi:formylglycine-generating enzyme required for sulfatase activity